MFGNEINIRFLSGGKYGLQLNQQCCSVGVVVAPVRYQFIR